MSICRITEQKLFGTITNVGFYQIENNCIVAHYYKKNIKREFFYNISDLQQQFTDDGNEILIDSFKNIKITLNVQHLSNMSKDSKIQEDSDKYFDFIPHGYRSYSDVIFVNPTSFTPDSIHRYFDE
ncbi:Hypothetical_protein [Hexamita inflata]|uniref:Hypothetical_protein n=1 Tax=Hexamita inflata TaxID=28002 RepID=A0AA86NZF5_9EUKA|nr:Hypothetical protein HINF_LOCUS15725 [Hexamita inflata]